MYIEQRQHLAALHASLTSPTQSHSTQVTQKTLALNQQHQGRLPLLGASHASYDGPVTCQDGSIFRISASLSSQQCPRACKCQCHTRASIRTPLWLRCALGQLFWTYESSISMRSCDYAPCRKSFGKHHFTYYFPRWLISRAFVASANMDALFGAGAKVLVNIPLIVPEEDHLVWSLVMAGNLEQLRHLLLADKNLVHVRNQWGQTILHVSNVPTFCIISLEHGPWPVMKAGILSPPELTTNRICRSLPKYINLLSSTSCSPLVWMCILQTKTKRQPQRLS